MSPPFPARCLQLFCGLLRFFASLPPSPILFSFPSSPFPSPLLSSLPSPFPSPFPSSVRLRAPTPVLVPAPSPLPSPLPSCAPSFTYTQFPLLPLRPRPHGRSRPRYRLRSHPRLQPRPDPVHSFLPLGPGYPPGTMRLYRRRALRMGLSGARKRHPLSAEIGDPCGMKVPAVKQKRIAAEDVLLLSLPPDVRTHWSMSPTCAVPV